MKKSEIVVGGVYSNRKGGVRKVVDIGDHPLYSGQSDRDDVLYEFVNDWTKNNRAAGLHGVRTRSSFALWAKERVYDI